MRDDSGSQSDPDPTSVELRQAAAGDLDSLEWLVHRFTPLLLAQAHHRIGEALGKRVPPVELVQEVWAIALPRLGELVAGAGRATPVVVKFLGTVCDLRIRAHVRALERENAMFEAPGPEALHGLPADQSGLVTGVARRELFEKVRAAMDSLSSEEREVLLLRILEQRTGAEVARLLGLEPNAVYVRQHRALAALRGVLQADLFDEFDRSSELPPGEA